MCRKTIEAAYDDIPRAVEELIFVDSGVRVSVRPETTFGGYLDPSLGSHCHYSVKRTSA